MEENINTEEKMPSPEETKRVMDAVDTFLAAIKELGPEFSALMAVGAPGDACMVACQMPEDRTKILDLITAMVSWMAAGFRWTAEDVRVFTDRIADRVADHIARRAAEGEYED